RELVGDRSAGDASGPDVYLATQLYVDGGHTALIGDFVRALGQEKTARLILTNIENLNPAPLPETIRSRLAVAPKNISILTGESLAVRLESLVAQLLETKPRRLFLFHHPDDPIACAASQPEIARQRIMVHHTDFAPSLGLHLPGIQLIDLNPIAASVSRVLGLTSSWLPLFAPDPGPRPAGFLRRGKVVTASSGGAFKFTRDYFYSYPRTVAIVLRETGGWHVHIGGLEAKTLSEIEEALAREGVARERFIHIPWVFSVAKALWENDVDLFLASFPLDGARTSAEVFASATPYLGHSANPRSDADGKIFWNTWDRLNEILHAADEKFLEEHARISRRIYEDLHQPREFRARLLRILDGQGGREDPQAEQRDLRTMKGMLRALIAAAYQEDAD
ncbi:MAG: hypothetical protein M3128_14205, partial [Verrucomicrobiota bacterium]|nr:hypothetical protein [Verrucomicrobiota bacterium]